MDNVTLYYSIIIVCILGAKQNFLKWADKEKNAKLDELVVYGCQIGAQVHRAGGEGGHLSPMVKAEGFHAEKKCCQRRNIRIINAMSLWCYGSTSYSQPRPKPDPC